MTKRFLALALCLALALAGCAPAQPPTEPSSVLLGASREEEPAPGDTSPPDTPSGFDDLEEAAKVLTGTILKDALLVGAADGWHGEEELLDLRTFTIWVPITQGHPYLEWFPFEEEDYLYCYPKEAIRQMVWEVFGIQDWSPEDLSPLEWNGEKDRWQSSLGFGTRWAAFQADKEKMTTAWQDEDTLTVLAPLWVEGTVHGNPSFLPLGDAAFTYRRMEEDGHTFLRFTAMEVEKYKTFRYNTVPGVTIPEGPVGKVRYKDGYVGNDITIDEPDTIAAILDLLAQITVYDLPDEPDEKTRPFGFTSYQFFVGPEDEEPAFTVYLNPFCVEAGGKRSGCYQADDSSSSESGDFSLTKQMYAEMETVILKRPREGKKLFQIPFQDADGSLRTLNFHLPENWTTDGYNINLPVEGDQKGLEISAYAPGSSSLQNMTDETAGWEYRQIGGRHYWCMVENYPILSQTEKVVYSYDIRRYCFYEKGYYFQISFFQNQETMPVTTEEFEEMLWDLVYIQERGPDQMADVVLEEQAIIQ